MTIFTADQAELSKALTWVGSALPTRTPYPALLGIHLRAGDDHVTATGYDDLGAHSVTIPAAVDTPGSALAPGALLRDLVKALGPGPVDVSASERGTELETSGAHYRLGSLPLDDYPPTPEVPETVGYVHRAGDLSDMLSAIGAAVDDTPEVARGGVHIEALDGHLSLAGVSPSLVIFRAIEWSGVDFRERVSPGLFADALRGFNPREELAIGCSHGLLSLSDLTRTAVMRLYNPAKMEWRKLLRGEVDPNSADVSVTELAGALRRAALLNPGSVKLWGEPGGFLNVECDGALELLDAEIDGSFEASLNPAFLSVAIGAVSGPSGVVRMGAVDEPRKPVIVRSADPGVIGAAVIAPKRED